MTYILMCTHDDNGWPTRASFVSDSILLLDSGVNASQPVLQECCGDNDHECNIKILENAFIFYIRCIHYKYQFMFVFSFSFFR